MITYRIERQKRRSVSLRVADDGEVIVKAPMRMATRIIEDFVVKHSEWIAKHRGLLETRRAKNSDILNFKSVMIFGEKKSLILGEKNRITADSVYLQEIGQLKKVLSKQYAGILTDCVNRIAETQSVLPSSVQVRAFKSRWGSCDAKGVIKLNWKLIFLPLPIIEYVVCHELSHLSEMNHSNAFWSEVQNLCPDYKKLREDIKEYSYLCKMY